MEKSGCQSGGFQFCRLFCVLWMTIWLQFAAVHCIATISGANVQQPDDFDRNYHRHSTLRSQRYMKQHDSVYRELLQVGEEANIEEEVETWVEGDRLMFKNPHHIGSVPIKDWDEQRRAWMAKHSKNSKKKTKKNKPSVLLITGSQPGPCFHPQGDHFHLKALKNKIDYARIHNFEIFHNLWFLDPLLAGYWSKLPIIRSLMLSHPETEWMIWMDMDAIFTDMLFEIPFHLYDEHNMVMWAWMDGVKLKDWVSVNDGVFLIRNCQWSLDLLDQWSPLGSSAGKIKEEAGKFLSSVLTNRLPEYLADDQSALMYLMLTDKEIMDKVKLIEKEYKLHGYWVDIVPLYEKYMRNFHPGLGDCRWPFVTHFTGCSPCSGQNNPDFPLEMCLENFNRGFNFADNQVMAYMGYQHKNLSSSELVRTRDETTHPLEYVGVNPWNDKIASVAAAGLPVDCYNF